MGEDGGLWGWKGMGVPMADGGDGVSMGMEGMGVSMGWGLYGDGVPLGSGHPAQGQGQTAAP